MDNANGARNGPDDELERAIGLAERAQHEDGQMYREVQGLMRGYPVDSPGFRALVNINLDLYHRQLHRAVGLAGARGARRRRVSVYDYADLVG